LGQIGLATTIASILAVPVLLYGLFLLLAVFPKTSLN
jgi:hypothetical protein